MHHSDVASSGNRLLPTVAILLVCVIGADVVRRSLPRPAAAPQPRDTTTIGGGPADTTHDSVAALARSKEWIRERIAAESSSTYLPETVRLADSTVRRWPDERLRRPLLVTVTRQPIDGFRESFVSDVGFALGRWNGVLPTSLDAGADSAQADIVIIWTRQLDSNRTGRTDVTWDRRGHIHHALVVLATHSPDGRLLDDRRMAALALHELGHAIGLNHSPDRNDAMHPVAYATELSDRDRATTRLLYSLPTGSIR